VWRRLRRRSARPGQPRDHRPRPHRPAQPRPPRRRRGRAVVRRWRRDHRAGARRVPAGRVRPGPARARCVRGRHRVPAARARAGGAGGGDRRADRGRRRPARARLARRPGAAGRPRPHGPQRHAGVPPGLPQRCRRRDRAGARATGLRRPQGGRAAGRRGRGRALLPVAVLAHVGLQGHAHHRPARERLPRPHRRALRQRDRPGAQPVLDQHVSVLAARASLPLHRAQRRDQHDPREPQLDAHAAGAARDRPHPRRPQATVPDLHAGRQRFGHVRRGARAAAPRRAQPAPRGADDDPGGVGEQPRDGPGPPRLLRVPRLADGAVGRTGLRQLHRRHGHRGGARPQRPAPRPVVADLRRPGRARQRDRRARTRPGDGRGQGPAAAGPDVPGRHRARRDRLRRRREGRTGGRAPVRRVAARGSDRAGGAARA
jgi:hypothetical protein